MPHNEETEYVLYVYEIQNRLAIAARYCSILKSYLSVQYSFSVCLTPLIVIQLSNHFLLLSVNVISHFYLVR